MVIGVAALVLSRHLRSPLPEAIAGDFFFLSFVVMSWWLLLHMNVRRSAAPGRY